jgi:hypothetical protein
MNREYNTLDEYLKSNSFTIDKQIPDGAGVTFPVRGREIEAAILFADITNFSGRTNRLSAPETLAFINLFMTWISAEAVKHSVGIVDKYIGDEIMMVFSKEFGSEDSVKDALTTGRRICEYDPWGFSPHIGIASGKVIVGYTGSSTKYDCSVFGSPVAVANRCANHKLQNEKPSYIVVPSELWTYNDVNEIFPPRTFVDPNGKSSKGNQIWHTEKTGVNVKGPNIDAIAIIRGTIWIPRQSAEDYVKESLDDQIITSDRK